MFIDGSITRLCWRRRVARKRSVIGEFRLVGAQVFLGANVIPVQGDQSRFDIALFLREVLEIRQQLHALWNGNSRRDQRRLRMCDVVFNSIEVIMRSLNIRRNPHDSLAKRKKLVTGLIGGGELEFLRPRANAVIIGPAGTFGKARDGRQ